MTPHQTQTFLDGSEAIKIYPGGRWKVMRGASNGSHDCEASYYDCQAAVFVEAQNKFIGDFHRESVTKVRRGGRP